MASFITNLLTKVGILQSDDEGEVVPIRPPEEVVEDASPLPAPTRVLTLKALMDEAVSRDAEERESTLAREMGLDVAWKTIFETAGVTSPAHGWTVEKALAFLRKAQAKGMTPVQVRRSLEAALIADGADVADVARDAVAKDEVLDLYELELENHLGAHMEQLASEIGVIDGEIQRLEARKHDIEEERAAALRRLNAWKSEKKHLEQQWAKVMTAIAPLV